MANESLSREPLPFLVDLCKSSNEFLDKLDIAALNLICASGLPGADALPIGDLLGWIDEAAETVRYETDRHYDKFLNNPAAFELSQAKFCILYLVTVLQRKLGVRYNPKWQDLTPDSPNPREFGLDSNDVFIHAIINGIGGTCASLPVLYVAVGRRLGYPLKLVKAFRHLFIRWDDRGGTHWHHPDQFNIEATGPGVHFPPDSHYKTWPRETSNEDLQAGIFLKSLTPSEELAEFLATRGYCLIHHRRLQEAVDVFSYAVQLAPHNRYFERARQGLMIHLAMLKRGHTYVNAPVIGPPRDWPRGPQWVTGSNGQEVLVQVPKPGHFQTPPFGGTRWPLVPQLVKLPNGQIANAHVPMHGSGSPAQAEWLQLPGGDYALVHRPVPNAWHHPVQSYFGQRNGQPVLPDAGPVRHRHSHPSDSREMLPYERTAIVAALAQLRDMLPHESAEESMPSIHALAMPPGPIRPALPLRA